MRRADRLFQIVQFLRGGRLVTARQLAEKLEVSERTIYRDVADLIGSGVPVEGEAGVGYVMRGGYDLPPLMFTQDEIVALVAGARLIRAWGGLSMAAAAEEALVKINAVLPDDAKTRLERVQIHALTFDGIDDVVRDRLDRIEAAINARHRIDIDYTKDTAKDGGATDQRLLRPLGLFFWGKVWTLVAWCELRNDFRNFRVDRIDRMELGEPFKDDRDKTLMAFYDLQRRRGYSPPSSGPVI
ncbi:helix-turn-helix transcriptional regulator [Pseudooceanicola sp. MF1-13]|uniref:helix-turn-helix transcriptional regulator n=1 Tax=Pseudooceanicola sp. MF1-13 TaxID=3379095 RepID=UPI0038927204